MKFLIIGALLTVTYWANGQEEKPAPCVGFYCGPECKKYEYLYAPGCDYFLEEATCDNPNPVIDKNGGILCDYAKCYCKAPNVRYNGHCIHPSQCPCKPVVTPKPEPGCGGAFAKAEANAEASSYT